MKISLVTETFPPEINGVSMTLGRLVNFINRQHEVSVVAPAIACRRDPGELDYRLIPVKGYPIPGYPELKFGHPSCRKLVCLWKEERPDIIHLATEGPLGWSALRAAQKLDIPVVSSFHTNFHNYTRHYGFSPLAKLVLLWLKYFHNRCRRTFVPSIDVLTELQKVGIHNLDILERGVDAQLFNPGRRDETLRKSWGATPSTPVAVYVGRIASEKNLELMTRAYARMRSVIPELMLVMVGDGPVRNKLESQYPDIHFAGMRQGEDLAGHYASADCFLFASTTETFGNVITEAMASGLPVLAYNYAAAARFIQDGKSGATAPFDDSQAFLDRAQELAHQRHLWKSMGQAARQAISGQTWEAIGEKYLIQLNEIACSEFTPAQTNEHIQEASIKV